MSLCDNEELDYAFARIGEDYDDNEFRGENVYDHFYLSRNIEEN